MLPRPSPPALTRLATRAVCPSYPSRSLRIHPLRRTVSTQPPLLQHALRSASPATLSIQPRRAFTTTPIPYYASPPPADALMERLTDLYGTARDEFEIAAEETEKKTVYAADDREAAKEAFEELKRAYEEALTQSEPEVGKEVQGRVGQRVRELGNALTALEESALEHD